MRNSCSRRTPPGARRRVRKTRLRVLLLRHQVLEKFKEPANKETLLGVIAECEAGDPAQAGMMKMMKLMPAVQQMLEPVLEGRDLMSVGMQMQAFGAEDPTIAADVGKLMKAVQGDLTDLV